MRLKNTLNGWWLTEFTQKEIKNLILYIKLTNTEDSFGMYLFDLIIQEGNIIEVIPLELEEVSIIKEFIELEL